MVDFVEQATLKVRDQSTDALRKINRELNKVATTAAKINGLKIQLNMKGAQRDVAALNKSIKSIPASKRVQVQVAATGVAQAKAQLDAVAKTKRTATITAKADTRAAATALQSITRPRTLAIKAQLTGNAGAQIKQLTQAQTVKVKLQGPGATSPLNINTSALTFAITDAFVRGAATVSKAIAESFGRQAVAADVADTSINVLNLPPEKRAAFDASVAELQVQFPQFNTAQLETLLGESMRQTNNDIKASKELTKQLAEVAAQQVTQGVPVPQAIDKASTLGKSAQIAGKTTDAEGNFSGEILRAYLDDVKRSMVVIGKELDAAFERTLNKNLGAASFALDERGRNTARQLGEEMGPDTAGVALRQAEKQLSGVQQTKYRLTYMEDLGLLTTQQVKVGTVDGKDVTETRTGQPVDPSLLAKDPAKWVAKYLIPAAQKAGVDTNDPAQVVPFVNKVVGDVSAQRAVTSLILRNQEIQLANDAQSRVDVSAETQKRIQSESLTTSLAVAESGFNNALQAAAGALEGVFIPALNQVGAVGNTIAGLINAATPGQLATGAAATAVGGGIVAKQLLTALNPLNGSATALNTSASMLQAAARSLGAAGGADLGGVGPDERGKGKVRGRLPRRVSVGGGAGGAAVGTAGAVAGGMASGEDVGDAILNSLPLIAAEAVIGALGLPAVGAAISLWALDTFDPNGNLGGATSGIDKWTSENFGFDLSKGFNQFVQTGDDNATPVDAAALAKYAEVQKQNTEAVSKLSTSYAESMIPKEDPRSWKEWLIGDAAKPGFNFAKANGVETKAAPNEINVSTAILKAETLKADPGAARVEPAKFLPPQGTANVLPTPTGPTAVTVEGTIPVKSVDETGKGIVAENMAGFDAMPQLTMFQQALGTSAGNLDTAGATLTGAGESLAAAMTPLGDAGASLQSAAAALTAAASSLANVQVNTSVNVTAETPKLDTGAQIPQ